MIFKLQPVLLDKIWGGTQLKKTYDTHLNNIGEVWGISAHPSFSNTLNDTNQTLRDLYINERHYFGNYPSDEFPILMKLIDAKDDLSVQVHPDDSYAKQFNSLGKEECWVVLDAKKDSNIIIGHQAHDQQTLKDAINNHTLMSQLNMYPVKKGDYFYIPAGTVHAILKDTLILEVSQSSDITYRLYDYDRKDQKGHTRELHIKESLDVINIPDKQIIQKHIHRYFKFDVLELNGEKNFLTDQYGDYIGIIEGDGFIHDIPCHFGDFFMITSFDAYVLKGNFKFVKVNLI